MKCEDCKHGKYQEAGGLSWIACAITEDETTCEKYEPKDTKCS